MDFIIEIFSFLKTRKKFWLLPIIIALLLFSVLIVLTTGTAIGPFIYTLF
jgi:competence protein ComGC